MGGKLAVVELRKKDRSTPAIASSGYSEDPVMCNPPLFGFTGNIGKPYKANDVAVLFNKLFPENR